jgi:hypothetical protein
MSDTAYLAQQTESRIREYLTEVRERNEVSSVPVFDLFAKFGGEVSYRNPHTFQLQPRRGLITSGFFNRIIADMKRAGVIGAVKGGERVFLSDAAWALHLQKASAKAGV